MDKFEITTSIGTFSAVELKAPNSDITTDILAIMLLKNNRTTDDLELLGYSWGASMMTDEEIMEMLIEEISTYTRKHKGDQGKSAEYHVTLTEKEIYRAMLTLEVDANLVASDTYVPVESEYKQGEVSADIEVYNKLAEVVGEENLTIKGF